MRSFLRFNRGLFGMPPHWQLWLAMLVGANGVAPFFFLEHVEAQVTIGALLISMTLMTILTARFGFSRILGLGHVAAPDALMSAQFDLASGSAEALGIRPMDVEALRSRCPHL